MLNFISAVNPMTILYSTLVLLVLALVFGVTLAVLGKKLAVHEDERIKQVREKLSGANCGGCGYAGCDAFAKAVVEGKADINACAATSAENKKAIADIMGQSIDAEETMIVVACRGGKYAVDKYEYMGYGNCRSMELLGGGRKQCKWGCLGMGSCVDSCPFSAMKVGEDGYAQVDREKCVACGRCINSCPKRLVKRVPASAKYYVACSNCLRGAKEVRGMHGGVPRLRTLCKGMPQRRNNSSKQPCRHRLLQMHGLWNMRVEMPLQMHFGNKTARQMICNANLGK